jgi:hypothetical protein
MLSTAERPSSTWGLVPFGVLAATQASTSACSAVRSSTSGPTATSRRIGRQRSTTVCTGRGSPNARRRAPRSGPSEVRLCGRRHPRGPARRRWRASISAVPHRRYAARRHSRRQHGGRLLCYRRFVFGWGLPPRCAVWELPAGNGTGVWGVGAGITGGAGGTGGCVSFAIATHLPPQVGRL